VPSGGSELESIVIGGSGGGGDGGKEGGGGASLSPRSSPRIAGKPEEKEESLDDAIILERLMSSPLAVTGNAGLICDYFCSQHGVSVIGGVIAFHLFPHLHGP
jgi:hypothetical protein